LKARPVKEKAAAFDQLLHLSADFEGLSDTSAITSRMRADPAKARVMGYFRELVADVLANWQALENGTIRLRLNTGETYLLDKATITRIT
jgi:hypothetical protein